MRVGLLGGTFNPPHIGHLVCAQEALRRSSSSTACCSCRCTSRRTRAIEADPGVEHRVELCRRAVAGDERLDVSLVDAEVPGPSYTVDTLRRLHERCPGDDLTFIVGGDMAFSLPTWREPEAILELAELGVAEREGVRRADISERLGDLPADRSPLLRHAPTRHLLLADPPPRGGRPPDPVPGAGRRRGLHRAGGAVPMTLAPDRLAELVAGYAADVKAIDPVELDLRDVLGYTDYFVIATGNTDRQAKAIHDRIHQGMKKEHGLLPRRVEGLGESRWILMDYLDVIVHIFTPEAREFYRLEQLWGEAPKRAVGE